MANVVTLIDDFDVMLKSNQHYLRRRFRYTRESTDNGIVIITPTAGSATEQLKGFYTVPWATSVGIGVRNNNSGAGRTLQSPPTLIGSVSFEAEEIVTGSEAENLEAASPRSWPASVGNNLEASRGYAIGQITPLNLIWLLFHSANEVAADWIITLLFLEGA